MPAFVVITIVIIVGIGCLYLYRREVDRIEMRKSNSQWEAMSRLREELKAEDGED